MKTEQKNEMKDDCQRYEMQVKEDSAKHARGPKHKAYVGFKGFRVFTINVACVNKKLTRVHRT